MEMEIDLEFLGVLFFEEKVHSDLRSSINKLSNSGIHTWIVSGDSRDNVINVGQSLEMIKNNVTVIDFDYTDDFDDIDVKMNLHLLQLINKSIYYILNF